jgi:hypothetical protein
MKKYWKIMKKVSQKNKKQWCKNNEESTAKIIK